VKTHGWAALAIWMLLGWGMWARGGFTFSFLFYTYSFIAAYGLLIRWVGLYGIRMRRAVVRPEDGAEPADGTFTAGTEALVLVTLERRVALPIPWLVVRDRAADAEHDKLHGPWLGRTLVYEYVLPLPKRGVFSFAPAEVWAGDPFGVVTQRKRVRTGLREIAVSPVPRAYGYEAERAILSLGEGVRGRARAGDEERSDYRAYRDGDPLTRVIWKMAARTEEWFVRRTQSASEAEETAIVVDRRSVTSAEAADRCAEAAAGAIVALGSRRRAFRYSEAGAAPDGYAPGWRRSLAALQPMTDAPILNSTAISPRAGAVIVVCAGLSAELADACREWRASGREVLVLQVRGEEQADENKLHAWLERGGIRLFELLAQGERTIAEGGADHALNAGGAGYIFRS